MDLYLGYARWLSSAHLLDCIHMVVFPLPYGRITLEWHQLLLRLLATVFWGKSNFRWIIVEWGRLNAVDPPEHRQMGQVMLAVWVESVCTDSCMCLGI